MSDSLLQLNNKETNIIWEWADSSQKKYINNQHNGMKRLATSLDIKKMKMSTWKAESGRQCEFKVSLDCRVCSRPIYLLKRSKMKIKN